jgi:hypothetical protein
VNSLLLFAVLGLILFISFLWIALRGAPRAVPDSSALGAVSAMLALEGSSFPNPNRLLDDTEYQILLSNPDLRRVARQFRKERQELVLLWISGLLADLKMLWRFRQFLIRQGVAATLREEFDIFLVFAISLSLLTFMKVSTRTLGPFAFARTNRRARRGVEKMSYATAGVLGRIPATVWPEIGRNWARTSA